MTELRAAAEPAQYRNLTADELGAIAGGADQCEYAFSILNLEISLCGGVFEANFGNGHKITAYYL